MHTNMMQHKYIYNFFKRILNENLRQQIPTLGNFLLYPMRSTGKLLESVSQQARLKGPSGKDYGTHGLN